MKVIDEQMINGVVEEAKKSPRLRMNYNPHQSLHETDGILEIKEGKDIYLAGGCFW